MEKNHTKIVPGQSVIMRYLNAFVWLRGINIPTFGKCQSINSVEYRTRHDPVLKFYHTIMRLLAELALC